MNGPLVRSRFVAMEVAHGVRFDTFSGTAPLKCIKIMISRAPSIKNTRGGHSRVRLHCTTSALRSGMHCCQRTSRLRCIRRVVKKREIHVANETSDVWDETSIASLPGGHEKSFQRSRIIFLVQITSTVRLFARSDSDSFFSCSGSCFSLADNFQFPGNRRGGVNSNTSVAQG